MNVFPTLLKEIPLKKSFTYFWTTVGTEPTICSAGVAGWPLHLNPRQEATSYESEGQILQLYYFCSLFFVQQDVEKFSDIEKLYLYLKLPSGPTSIIDKR